MVHVQTGIVYAEKSYAIRGRHVAMVDVPVAIEHPVRKVFTVWMENAAARMIRFIIRDSNHVVRGRVMRENVRVREKMCAVLGRCAYLEHVITNPQIVGQGNIFQTNMDVACAQKVMMPRKGKRIPIAVEMGNAYRDCVCVGIKKCVMLGKPVRQVPVWMHTDT